MALEVETVAVAAEAREVWEAVAASEMERAADSATERVAADSGSDSVAATAVAVVLAVALAGCCNRRGVCPARLGRRCASWRGRLRRKARPGLARVRPSSTQSLRRFQTPQFSARLCHRSCNLTRERGDRYPREVERPRWAHT